MKLTLIHITSLIISLLSSSDQLRAQYFNLNSEEFQIGDVYIPQPSIRYDLASIEIHVVCLPILDSISSFLISNDSLVIEVANHSDSRLSDKTSVNYTGMRAKSVLTYLVKAGVDADRLSSKGYGASQPKISSEDIENMQSPEKKEEAHAINRRTEFRIIDIRH